MGCVKSKSSRRLENAKPAAEKADQPRASQGADEKAGLVTSETGPDSVASETGPGSAATETGQGPGQASPKIDFALLDYAQRLSEEIVARAVQQWAELDSRYGDIPYIECDQP